MKILFLCGAFERGKDGVGDYTRRLSEELIKQGHEIVVIALNDTFISKKLQQEEDVDGYKLSTIRLPSTLSFRKRENWCKLKLAEIDPDWISLQFVPFSFHRKGLPYRLNKFLISIGKDKQWHFMMHELWVGIHEGASFKMQLWGVLQQRIILRLIRQIRPKAINTQTDLYKFLLQKEKIDATILPLFSNIPVVYRKSKGASKRLLFVLFGNIFPNTPIAQFTQELYKLTNESNHQIELVMLGRNGREKELWKLTWELHGFSVKILGEQSENTISKILSNADFGLSTTSYPLVMKSGSVAAMLEHGLPVICVAHEWKLKNSSKDFSVKNVLQYKENTLKQILFSDYKVEEHIGIKTIGAMFINFLQTANYNYPFVNSSNS